MVMSKHIPSLKQYMINFVNLYAQFDLKLQAVQQTLYATSRN